MLTELQKVAFRLHKVLFFYMPPMPGHWGQNFDKVELVSSYIKWIPWLILSSTIPLIGCVCCYTVLLCGVYSPRKDFERINVGLLTVCGVAMIVVGYFILTGVRHLNLLTYGYNELLRLENLMNKKFPAYRAQNRNNSHKADPTGILACCTMIIAAPAPVFIIFVAISAEFDAMYFILEHFLPDPITSQHFTTTMFT
ncbi:unnamed protein product [Orchesella dallaii]|uniref:Uncharacterized protein n=1 Tax=Orchesella dallaii TaxID=48710 RepID=A0ABP1Q2W7_9HEXA